MRTLWNLLYIALTLPVWGHGMKTLFETRPNLTTALGIITIVVGVNAFLSENKN